MDGSPLQIYSSPIRPSLRRPGWRGCLTECCDVVWSSKPTRISSFLSWSVKWPFIELSLLFLSPCIECDQPKHRIDRHVQFGVILVICYLTSDHFTILLAGNRATCYIYWCWIIWSWISYFFAAVDHLIKIIAGLVYISHIYSPGGTSYQMDCFIISLSNKTKGHTHKLNLYLLCYKPLAPIVHTLVYLAPHCNILL